MTIWLCGGLSILVLFIDFSFLLLVTSGMGVGIVAITQALGAVSGLWLLRRKDLTLVFYLHHKWSRSEYVVAELWEEGMKLLGCLLMIAPGFLSDLVGLLILIPSTQKEVFVALRFILTRTHF